MTTPAPTAEPIAEPRTCRSPRGRRVGVILAAIAMVLAAGLWWWHRPPPPAAPRLLLPIVEDGKWGMIDADTGAVVIPPTWWGIELPRATMDVQPRAARFEPYAWTKRRENYEGLYGMSRMITLQSQSGFLEPISVFIGKQSKPQVARKPDFPYVRLVYYTSATALTVDNRVIEGARYDDACAIGSHWLVMAQKDGQRSLRSMADLRAQSLPVGARIGALGETLWSVDVTAGVATMRAPNDTWTVPFPAPPPSSTGTQRNASWRVASVTLLHWRYGGRPSAEPMADPAQAGARIDLVVAGYSSGSEFSIKALVPRNAESQVAQLLGRVCRPGQFFDGHRVYDATVSWRRGGQSITEAVPYSVVWSGMPAPDGSPVWFGIRQGWLVRLSPDGPEPVAEVGPALKRSAAKAYQIDQWSPTGLDFSKPKSRKLNRSPVDDELFETVAVMGARVLTLPGSVSIRWQFEWQDRLFLGSDRGLYEVLPSGEVRRFGSETETESESETKLGNVLHAEVQGDRLTLLGFDGSTSQNDRSKGATSVCYVEKAWLADYDRDGQLLKKHPASITSRCTLYVYEDQVYIEDYPDGDGPTDTPRMALLDRHLQPLLPADVECLGMVAPGTSADAPGEWALWLRRDGDHYIGDLHGARRQDLPDDGLLRVTRFPSLPACWLLERADGTEILDESGATIARLPNIVGVSANIGGHWVYTDGSGTHLVDSQGREQLDRPFNKILQVTEHVLLVESIDEARYLRLPDLRVLWRSKPGYAVSVNSLEGWSY